MTERGQAIRIGAVDCGTNATRLLVADVMPGPDAVLREVSRELLITRMGEGIGESGRIGDLALARVEAALRSHARTCREREVARVAAVATSAARDAVNVTQFTDVVVGTLGVMPDVLTGEQEAVATFRGAIAGLDQPDVTSGRTLVVDVGGGSTELAVGSPGRSDPVVVSLPIGCVRLTEAMLRDDPPTPEQAAAARAAVRDQLAPALRRVGVTPAAAAAGAGGAVVGVAGTALTLGALHAGLDDADARELHGARLPAAALADLTQWLLATPVVDIGRLPPLVAGREDVLAAGALILDALVDLLAADALVLSRHDLLDDLARRTAAATVEPA